MLSFGHGRQHTGAALHPLAHLHAENRLGRQQHIHAGAKFDEADALAASQNIALMAVEDDAPGQKAGNLLEGCLLYTS